VGLRASTLDLVGPVCSLCVLHGGLYGKRDGILPSLGSTGGGEDLWLAGRVPGHEGQLAVGRRHPGCDDSAGSQPATPNGRAERPHMPCETAEANGRIERAHRGDRARSHGWCHRRRASWPRARGRRRPRPAAPRARRPRRAPPPPPRAGSQARRAAGELCVTSSANPYLAQSWEGREDGGDGGGGHYMGGRGGWGKMGMPAGCRAWRAASRQHRAAACPRPHQGLCGPPAPPPPAAPRPAQG
jgi:hypothetical protein